MKKNNGVNKVVRFIRIYGLGKTCYKVLGRLRVKLKLLGPRKSRRWRDVGVIGCGQFTFATVGFSLCKKFGNRFVSCYDVNATASKTFADFYKIHSPASTASELIKNDQVKCVYVASNHASHSEYARQALAAGKSVYVEKPIAVSVEQLSQLMIAIKKSRSDIWAGYNRPFSKAIRLLRKYTDDHGAPLTLNCFVSGHKIPPEHWYRNPEEGTRICGNVGHWLDLAVHILSWGEMADDWFIQISYSDMTSRDDDITITMTSSHGDLISITLTSRCEPFEGINETINFQQSHTICKIDDFRRMQVWKENRVFKKRFWPKDVGHELALLQPFQQESQRDWAEVVLSSLLMLHIAEMVKEGIKQSNFSFVDAKAQLNENIRSYEANSTKIV